MKNIGAVLVDLTGATDKLAIRAEISQSLSLLPAGRNLTAFWEPDAIWGPRPPIEAWVTQEILGIPSEREKLDVDFFGNGVVRVYQEGSTSPSSTWQWLSFRRTGERAYARRKTAPQDIVDESTLSTLDPVFTRDAANNVWHIPAHSARSRIIERFQVLLTWSDEETLVLLGQHFQALPYPEVSFSEGLIGVANKTSYVWK